MSTFTVCALYKFVKLPQFEALRLPLIDVMESHGVRGTLLLADEGINGTIAGTAAGIEAVLAWLSAQPALGDLVCKYSYCEAMPFNRSKVKLKKEIVTLGVEGVDPLKVVGTYVKPQDWNALISDPDVVLVDTRNDYEYQIGTFKGALNPNTETFREFPAYVAANLDPAKHKKVAMFCTGGIRCEKSTAYLKEQGFEAVYHLEGGILKYLEDVPADNSLWEGECFVFDERVAVNHDLQKGQYDQCHACRYPITEADKLSPHYAHGVSCPRCYDKVSAEKKASLQEREKQIELARERGETHLGGDAKKEAAQRRAQKQAKKAADRASHLVAKKP
jgi:UPF0176 protein